MNEYKRIDYRSLFIFILKKSWIVLLAAVVFAVSAFSFTKYAITPQYKATIRLYVNNKTEATTSLTSSDVSASKSLVNTYITIIESDSVIDEIVEKSEYKYTNEQIFGMLSAKSINGTEVFEVSASGPSAEECADVANLIADLAPEKISEIVEGSSVRIVDRAKVPNGPISPSIPRNVLTAFLIGIVVSCVIIFFIYISDTTIYSEEDIGEFCTLPVLGVLPDLLQADQSKNSYPYAYGGGSTGK